MQWIERVKVYDTASANQVGQHLLCFVGVDSIGNQGDSRFLRFTVQLALEGQNTLYINNATHYPAGLVSKYQSTFLYLTRSWCIFTNSNLLKRFDGNQR